MHNNGDNKFVYPYRALSPVSRKSKRFNNINDVYLELCECYDNALEIDSNKIGDIVYTEHFFFCNTYELLDKEAQMTIKKYNFCKTFNSPPFPSLDQTPAKIFEDFMKIENEHNVHKNQLRDSSGNK